MPCCCESNIKACFYLRIIFIVLNIAALATQYGDVKAIVVGLIFALVNGLLVIGAHLRNKTCILVWIVLAVIQAIVLIIFTILLIVAIVALVAQGQGYQSVVGAVLAIFSIALIIYVIIATLLIWAIVIANRAIKEIENPNANVTVWFFSHANIDHLEYIL